jgi:signal peptidase I
VVKRVMGIPGDRIHLKDGVVYRNGERLNEPYMYPLSNYVEYRDDFPTISPEHSSNVNSEWAVTMQRYVENGELVVPPGMYFAMGDHRDLSLDSRYWGFIPRENIIGRPMFIYWSFDTPENQYQASSVPERLKWLLHVVFRFIPDTRWTRTLNLIR